MDDLAPVIVGVGQAEDRPGDPFDGMDSIALMMASLRQAEADAGVDLLGRIGWLGVEEQISFPYPEGTGDRLASQLPSPPGQTYVTEEASGDGPVHLLNDAANLIARGEVQIAAITGAEAMRTAMQRAKLAPATGSADPLASASEERASALALRYRLLTPVDVYPLYENATRAAWDLSLAEAQAETGAIWSGFSQTAAQNPHAWLREPLSPEQITQPSPSNRMLNHPYTKLMVANNSVNQGAAVILTSLAKARALGVAEDRLIFVGDGAAAAESDDFLLRDSYTHSASLTASIEGALEFNGLDAGDLDHVEFYSCFPCVPKLARRVLDWPLDRPHSVYGGLTFGGGPIGNCMMHAVAAMVEKLRESGRHGMVVANGGFLTHAHAIVLSKDGVEMGERRFDYDVQDRADAMRHPVPRLLDDYAGPGTIETFTVPFTRDGQPACAIIVARNPAGERFLAMVPPDNDRLLQGMIAGERDFIGDSGDAQTLPDGRAVWNQ